MLALMMKNLFVGMKFFQCQILTSLLFFFHSSKSDGKNWVHFNAMTYKGNFEVLMKVEIVKPD